MGYSWKNGNCGKAEVHSLVTVRTRIREIGQMVHRLPNLATVP